MFYISTSGSTASKWLTRALNQHPEFVVFHGLKSLDKEAPAGVDDETLAERFFPTLERVAQTSFEDKVVGAIHGWPGFTIKAKAEAFGAAYMAMMRHPVLRGHSLFLRMLVRFNPLNLSDRDVFNALKSEQWPQTEFNFTQQTPLLEPYAQRFHEICRSVVLADCWDLQNTSAEKIIDFERLVSSKEYFRTCFDYISAGRCATESYIDSVFSIGVVNKKTKKNWTEAMSAEDVFDLWPAPFRMLFAAALKSNGGTFMIKLYEEFGYLMPKPLTKISYIHWSEALWTGLTTNLGSSSS